MSGQDPDLPLLRLQLSFEALERIGDGEDLRPTCFGRASSQIVERICGPPAHKRE